MKYIRTKDGIFEVANERTITEFQVIDHLHNRAFLKDEILAQADTIEELCDEFVYIKDGVVNQYLTIDFKHKREDEYCSLRNKLTANGIAETTKGISKYELEKGELKFAIWTDKGLIYVAKLNKNGELELI